MSTEKKNTRSEQARINGRESRGPKTKEGKERSSQNALKHGLTSKTFILMQDEVLEEYEAIRDSFMEYYNPQTAHEVCSVHLIAQLEWKCLRVGRLEDEAREALSNRWNEGLKRAITVDGFETKLQSYGRQLSNLRLNIKRAEQDLERRQSKRGIGILPMRPTGILPVAEDEITKSQRNGDPGECSESGRTQERGVGVSPAKEESAEPQHPHSNNQQLTHQQLNTKRTQEQLHPACPERSRRVPPPREEPTEPLSPRALEPHEAEITKRTQEQLQTSPEPRSLEASEPSTTHANNQQPTRQQQEFTKRTQRPLTDPEKTALSIRARIFLTTGRRFHTVGDVRLVWGIQGLALCLAYAAADEEARWLWVIVGDLPPAHLPTGTCPNAGEALKEYTAELQAWLAAAKQGEEPSNDEYIPMLHPVTFKRLKPTAEARTFIENRARFVFEQVLHTHGDELRAIGIHRPSTC